MIVEAVAAASTLRNQHTQIEERLAGVDREAQRLQSEMTAANSQMEAFRRTTRPTGPGI